jgi:serine/threonine protein kinase
MLRAVRVPFEGMEDDVSCYASPEFAAYRPLQKQVDVYGLGAVLYGLLTLREPTGRFVRPSSVRPGLPRTVDEILLRALDEDPDERYPTPSAVARSLEGLWALGTRRQELEMAADRLSEDVAPDSRETRVPTTLEKQVGLLEAGDETLEGRPPRSEAISLLFSDKVRAVCLVLLMLLNLGLFCQAIMEAGSSAGKDLSDPKELRRWESVFSDSGLGGMAGPVEAG